MDPVACQKARYGHLTEYTNQQNLLYDSQSIWDYFHDRFILVLSYFTTPATKK